MEDDKTTTGGVVYETVPVETEHATGEIPEETPEGMRMENFPLEEPPPPAFEENKNKYLIIGIFVIIFIFIFLLMIRFFLSSRKSGDKKTTLTYWGLWEDESVFKPLIADYERANTKIQIKYKKLSPKDYRQKLLARDEKTQDRPDIFRYHNTWIPSIRQVLAELPKKVMTNTEFEKTFYPVAAVDLKIGDSYYGLPLEVDGLVLIYNDDLFKKAGIETSPRTWEDIVDYSSRLTVVQDGQIITSGIALGTASNVAFFSDIFGWMLLQDGVNLKNLNGKVASETLDAYRRFAEPPGNVWDERLPNSITAFVEGKVAMIFAPSWVILEIKARQPDLNLKVSSLPTLPGGKQIAFASYWVEGVSKYSKNQLEAWQFLKFLVEKDNLTKLYKEQSKTRLFGEPYSRIDLASTLVQNEYIGPLIQQAPNMKSLPTVSATFDDGINDKIIKYLEDAINARANGVSSAEALGTAKQGVSQIFKLYELE